MKQSFTLILLILAILTTACKKSQTTTTKSSVAQLTSFSFAKDTLNPGLSLAEFRVQELLDTGLVYCLDSIAYGTSIRKAVPKFTFAATPGSATMHLSNPDTLITLTGTDSIDFTRAPIYLSVVSQDGTRTKVYEIRVYVHAIDPDLFVWTCLNPAICDWEDIEQHVVLFHDAFYLYTNNGFLNHLYMSADGATWQDVGEPIGLPNDCRIKGILADSTTDNLYYMDEDILYTSADGVTWTQHDHSAKPFTLQTMLLSFNDTLWGVVEQRADATLYLAQVLEDTDNPGQYQVVPTTIELDEQFPISNFATVSFESSSLRERALIMGGYSRGGVSQNSRWSFEYSKTRREYNVRNFSIEKPEFQTITGVSIIWYNHCLYRFGGVDKNNVFVSHPILYSLDEGMSWQPVDTAKCRLPDTYYGVRHKQTAIVRDDCIYLFGGQTSYATFTDVYRGRLNSIGWK